MTMEQSRPKCYKPVAIRPPVFGLFCALTVVIIALLQVSAGSTGTEIPCTPVPPDNICPPTAPPPSNFSVFTNWTNAQYFYGAYLPTLIAVLYSGFWDIIYTRLKEMEPYFRLSQPLGASAKESILLHYTSSSLPSVLCRAIAYNHKVILFASLISLVLTISIPFASEVLYIGTTGLCSSTTIGSDCQPYLAIRPAIARGEEAAIGIVFFVALGLAIACWQRNSGIYSEGFSIAGMAILIHHDSAFTESLHRAWRASSSEIESYFNKHYALAQTQNLGQIQRDGLITIIQQDIDLPSNHAQEQKEVVVPNGATTQQRHGGAANIKSSHPFILRPGVIISALFFLSGLAVLILYYCFVGAPSGFEAFMDSQSVGVRFMMTSIGVLIKSYWTLLEKGTVTLQKIALDHFTIISVRVNERKKSAPLIHTAVSPPAMPGPKTQSLWNPARMLSQRSS